MDYEKIAKENSISVDLTKTYFDEKKFRFDNHFKFINEQLERLKNEIEGSNSVSIKDLADYHRFAESLMFLANAEKAIGR